ncbi:MAG TPA: SCO family protein [Gammaproteobacteria bacterium]
MNTPFPYRTTVLLLSLLLTLGTTAQAADGESGHAAHQMHDMHDMQEHSMATMQHDQHANHRQALNQTGYTRSLDHYTLPALELTTMNGDTLSLAQMLDTDQPVALNFIFTSCTTICPIMSATFAQAQKRLGDEASQIRWISVSIDPEYDTPERLRDYAQRFEAGKQWSFLTGSTENIIALQKAFDVYRGDKMNHIPVTLLRAGRNAPWVRLHGLTSGAELVQEYRQLMANR